MPTQAEERLGRKCSSAGAPAITSCTCRSRLAVEGEFPTCAPISRSVSVMQTRLAMTRVVWRPLSDIFYDVMWNVELEPEVGAWLDGIALTEFALVLPHIERLADRGSDLRMPASRSLGDGLFELRFEVNRISWRIPFFFADGRRIVLLTVFRKQRQNERHEVARARAAMARCIDEGHTAEEDN